MSSAANPAAAGSTPRPWWRLHLTTIIGMALAATPIVLSNVMDKGELVHISLSDGQRIDDLSGPVAGPMMTVFEYGWPQSWICMDASAPGPSFAPGSSLIRYRALLFDIVIWCGLLAVAAGAAEVARRRLAPRLQWNLRTMLLAVGAVCGLLAWCAMLERRATTQDAIIAEIEAADGRVYLERWGPRWLYLVGADRYRRTVVGVTLANMDANKADLRRLLRRLPALPSLRRLDLEATRVSNGDMKLLRPLDKLEELFLNETAITEAGLAHLSPLTNLKLLHLGTCDIGDDGLVHLRRLRNLECLYLSETPVLGHGLSHLADLDRLRLLDLAFSEVEDQALKGLAGLESLEELYLHGTAADDRAAAAIARLPKLRILDLAASFAGDAALEALSRSSTIEELGIDNYHPTGRGVSQLKSLPRLKVFHVAGYNAPYRIDLRFLSDSVPLKVGDGSIEVKPAEWEGWQTSLKLLKEANPHLRIHATRPISPDRRTDRGQRVKDDPGFADERIGYGAGFF